MTDANEPTADVSNPQELSRAPIGPEEEVVHSEIEDDLGEIDDDELDEESDANVDDDEFDDDFDDDFEDELEYEDEDLDDADDDDFDDPPKA